jgi:hypothetical protein
MEPMIGALGVLARHSSGCLKSLEMKVGLAKVCLEPKPHRNGFLALGSPVEKDGQ